MHAQRAVEVGAAAHASSARVYRVGYTPLLDATLLPQIRVLFARAVGDTALFFQSTYSTAQIDQILNGRLHAGLVVLPIASDELRAYTVFRHRLVAAVPCDSEVAERSILRPEDIASQPIIWFGQLTNFNLYQHFVQSCQKAGFTPNIAYEVSTVIEMLEAVSAGAGIGFVKDSVQSRLHPEGIVFRELATPELSIEIAVAYRNEDCSANLDALLRVMNQLLVAHLDDESSSVDAAPR